MQLDEMGLQGGKTDFAHPDSCFNASIDWASWKYNQLCACFLKINLSTFLTHTLCVKKLSIWKKPLNLEENYSSFTWHPPIRQLQCIQYIIKEILENSRDLDLCA